VQNAPGVMALDTVVSTNDVAGSRVVGTAVLGMVAAPGNVVELSTAGAAGAGAEPTA